MRARAVAGWREPERSERATKNRVLALKSPLEMPFNESIAQFIKAGSAG
jgi:hypothetical protein